MEFHEVLLIVLALIEDKTKNLIKTFGGVELEKKR